MHLKLCWLGGYVKHSRVELADPKTERKRRWEQVGDRNSLWTAQMEQYHDTICTWWRGETQITSKNHELALRESSWQNHPISHSHLYLRSNLPLTDGESRPKQCATPYLHVYPTAVSDCGLSGLSPTPFRGHRAPRKCTTKQKKASTPDTPVLDLGHDRQW
jgi:hypothetical protein